MKPLASIVLASTLTSCAAVQKVIEYQNSIKDIHTYSVYEGDYIVYTDMYGCNVYFEPDFRDDRYNQFSSRHPDMFTKQRLFNEFCDDLSSSQENNYKE
jgi:hypothetical protein